MDDLASPSLLTHPDALHRLTVGVGYGAAVHRLLSVARAQTGMQVAWLSEFVGSDQVLRFVDAQDGADAPTEGTVLPLSGSFCARVLDGRMPALIGDARATPQTALLDVTAALRIGAYVGVPILGVQGLATGMLCAVHPHAAPALSERDVEALRALADVLRDLQLRAVPATRAAEERSRAVDALTEVLRGTGRQAVLQPVVDLRTGRAVLAEGLTRFDRAAPGGGPPRSPAQWFDDAARHGMREDLELATAAAVLDRLPDVPADVLLTVNLGPQTLCGHGLAGLLAGRPLDRIVLEVTEHAVVADYADLAATLAPYRSQGLQVAVDDAGAGYASLRHVLQVQPDVVKVDMTLVRGADQDLARRTLLRALVAFCDDTGSRLVAEGVETTGELAALRACGVRLAQGFVLARPAAAPAWSGYPGC